MNLKNFKTKKKILLSSALALFSVALIGLNNSYQVNAEDDVQQYALGCIPDDEETLKSLQADELPMAANESLPNSVDLESKLPSPGNQGQQGSCTAWAVAYAAKSYQENQEHSWAINGWSTKTEFSPAYLYNQINGGVDKGSSITTAMRTIKEKGICSLYDMPYNENDYLTQPNTYQYERASNFKSAEYHTVKGTEAVKSELADGNPVIITIPVYSDFDNLNASNPIYDKIEGKSRGYHAICLIGYNENKKAFKLINSWGDNNWGIKGSYYSKYGYGYISYDLFEKSNVSNGWGYVMTDAVQHYKSNPIGVKALSNINVYSDTALKTKVKTISSGKQIKVLDYIKASNGNPPALKVDGGYITAKKDMTEKLNTYTVVYNSNGGSGSMSNTTVAYGISTNLRTNSYTRTGYTFNGWYAKRKSDSKWYYKSNSSEATGWYLEGAQPMGYVKYKYNDKQSIAKTSSVNNDTVTFYAQWQANTYTVVYNANGGSGTMANTTVSYGTSTPLRANTYTRTGYTFKGWYVKRTSDSKWFYKNYTTGATGWYLEGKQPNGFELSIYSDKQNILKTSSVNNDVTTFYAQWQANTYTVVYNANGGSGTMANTTVSYGTSTPLRANAYTRTGYTFKGWYVKRASDSKWFYKNYTTGATGWYLEGKQPNGFELSIYSDKQNISKTSSVNNDTATFYAQWTKI